MDAQKMEAAKSLLVEFIEKMNAWEIDSFALAGESGGLEKNLEKIKSGLVAVYDRFLARRERKTGRLAGPDVGYPPENDPANETIVALEALGAGKAVIEILWTHPVMRDFSEKRKYTLVFKGGEWRIDKKETFSPAKGKWVNRTF